MDPEELFAVTGNSQVTGCALLLGSLAAGVGRGCGSPCPPDGGLALEVSCPLSVPRKAFWGQGLL